MAKKKVTRKYGYIPDMPDIRDQKFGVAAPLLAGQLPSSVNSAPKFPDTPWDQKQEGSCTAHMACGMLQFDRAKQQLPTIMPSRQMQYYNARRLEGTTKQDAGATIRDAVKALAKFGVAPELLWPYLPSNMTKKPTAKCYKEALNHMAQTYHRVSQNRSVIQSVLAAGYVVGIGISVYESFESQAVADTGDVPMPGPGEQLLGGHAVIICGYDNATGKYTLRNSWGCYDDATEILTRDGWKTIGDVIVGEEVATLNPSTQSLEYQKVQQAHAYPYTGDLWAYKAQGVDLLVTPNHKMYIKEKTGGDKTAPKCWGLVAAERIKNRHFSMKKDAGWDADDVQVVDVCGHAVPVDLWAEFMGYWLSEGHTHKHVHERAARTRVRHRGGRDIVTREKARVQVEYIVGISQSKAENVAVMQRCLDTLPFRFSRHGDTWTTNNKQLFNLLHPLGKQTVRYMPPQMKCLSRRQSRILLEAMMRGDGTAVAQEVYYTSSSRLADDVQELVLKAGYAADVRFVNRVGRVQSGGTTRAIEYSVSIKKTRVQPTVTWNIEKVPYQGTVYCVTVPNHVVYVRRNGQATWCGNSDWGMQPEGCGTRGYFTLLYQYVEDSDLAADFWVINLVTG